MSTVPLPGGQRGLDARPVLAARLSRDRSAAAEPDLELDAGVAHHASVTQVACTSSLSTPPSDSWCTNATCPYIPVRGCSSISVAPAARRCVELGAQIGDAEREMVHALAPAREEPPDRRVVRERRQQLDAAAPRRAAATSASTPCSSTRSRASTRGAEEPLVALARLVQIAHGDADVVDAERGHARIVPRAQRRGSSGAIMHATYHQWGGDMGLFDKVKEKASDALEQGKEAAQTQQLKLQLRKLEGEVEEASAALGAAAFDLIEAGTLAAGGDARRARGARPRGPRGGRGQEGRDRERRRRRRRRRGRARRSPGCVQGARSRAASRPARPAS